MKEQHTFLWISGWSLTSDIWNPYYKEWPNAKHYSLSFENCRTIEQITDHAIQTFQQIESKLVIIVGWSLGAMVALQLARQFPKRIQHLFLIGGVHSFIRSEHNKTGWDERVIIRMNKQLKMDVNQVIRLFDQKMFSSQEKDIGEDEKWNKSIRKNISTVPSLQAGLEYLKHFTFHEHSKSIHTPVSLLSGADDMICPTESTRALAKQLPYSTCTIWEETGHACFWTHMVKFHQWMKEELSNEHR